ncbi:MAG: helix-turn-helix domain-containing protein [Chloroflexi bacterium]|nr:helix-turn-helix domain-containing protein [Chloroflexota bacterium]
MSRGMPWSTASLSDRRPLADVASAAGISAETLRKIETGRLPSPAFGSVVRLCEALDLDIDEVARIWTHDHVVAAEA